MSKTLKMEVFEKELKTFMVDMSNKLTTFNRDLDVLNERIKLLNKEAQIKFNS